jgi:DNA-binding LytR/AlgR family response regulator
LGKFTCALCEDNQSSLRYIEKQLTSLFELHGFPVSLDTYGSGVSLLAKLEKGERSYNAVFVDIEMPAMNGIDLCRKLRELSKDVYIIFVSNREEFVFKTFEVKPFRFIRKNHWSEDAPPMVNDLINELRQNEELLVPVAELHSDVIHSLDVGHIIYIEVFSRYCHIVSETKKEFDIQYKLKDMYELLKDYGFLQPHRSFIVNYRYIYRIEKDSVLLTNKKELPLSRSFREQFRNEFFSLMRKET